jgi:hypothetical protein
MAFQDGNLLGGGRHQQGIKALRGVNSLAASIALKKNLMVSVRVSLILSDGSDPTI